MQIKARCAIIAHLFALPRVATTLSDPVLGRFPECNFPLQNRFGSGCFQQQCAMLAMVQVGPYGAGVPKPEKTSIRPYEHHEYWDLWRQRGAGPDERTCPLW